jgi:O-antigen/teichoic acid export membrane protein
MPALARHFIYNLLGVGLPLLLAVVAMPLLAALVGLARLGFLTIAWALIGYLGFLDLGLSRVTARRVAAASTAEALAQEVRLMQRLVRVLAAGGIVVGAVLATLTPDRWLAAEHLPAALGAEVRLSWLLLVATLPLLLISNIWRGAMEGRQAFAAVNLYRLLFGAWMFGAPVVVAVVSPALPALIGVIVAGRVVLTWLHWRWCRRHLPRPVAPAPGGAAPSLGEALREGGWITLSNAVGPLMVVADRFILGALMPLAAVAAYAVPQEVALRLLIVPAALAITIFPAVAALGQGRAHGGDLVPRAMRASTAITLPFAFTLALFATPLLTLWMGADFAADSALVLKILMVGIAVNAPAQIVFSALQARARARTTALLHVVELLPYALLLWLAVSRLGIAGAALAWSLRVIADAVILMAIARAGDATAVDLRFGLAALATLVSVALAGVADAAAGALPWAMAAVTTALLAWAALLDRRDVDALRSMLQRTSRR